MYVERKRYPRKKVELEIRYTAQKGERRRKASKKIASKEKRKPHVKVEVEGTLSDFQKAIMDFGKALEKADNPKKRAEIEDICVFHWLDCLYQDYLDGAVVGTDNPCNSCPELCRCNVSAITNFNIAGEKYGLKVGKRQNAKGIN